jgi:hypothetical protein
MKKFLSIVWLVALCSCSSQAYNLKDLVSGASSVASSATSTTTTTTSSSSSSDILSKLGNLVSNATASSNFEVSDLVGTWSYVSPAVSFQSDNVLQSLSGAAASTAIEDKLATYYKTAGLNNITLTVASDQSFTMKLRFGTLKGTISKDSNNQLVFNFMAFGAYSIGSISAEATKSGSTLNLTFDAKKVIEVAQTVSAVTNNSTLTSAISLLSSYDGIYIGFKLKK